MSWFHSFLRLFCSRHAKLPHAETLIFGLGNPGSKYRNNRHNIGYRIVDALMGEMHDVESGTIFQSRFNAGEISGAGRVALIKPITFMNRSGISVNSWINQTNIALSKCLVIVDDFNLLLGTIRLRRDGSHGGHNGLKSVSEYIGTAFPRLRVGIGPLPQGIGVIDFVLGNSTVQEEEKLNIVISKAVQAVQLWIKEGTDAAMNKFNS